jgi:hypothetical protein
VLYPVELRAANLQNKATLLNYTPLYVLEKLVGVERFELPTSCSQSRRATRLRYTPNAQI